MIMIMNASMVNSMDKVKVVQETLKNRGIRPTYSRMMIVKTFVEEKTHLNADMVFDRVKDKGISIPTVYRTLDILKREEILSEMIYDQKRYFELKELKEDHMHHKCVECGSVQEFVDDDVLKCMQKASTLLGERYGILITDAHVMLSGLCKECAENAKTEEEEKDIILTQ